MKTWIPNALTSLNLVFGVFAILSVFNADFNLAAYCVVLALVADSLMAGPHDILALAVNSAKSSIRCAMPVRSAWRLQ